MFQSGVPAGHATYIGGATYMSNTYFDHISETIQARELIFCTGTN